MALPGILNTIVDQALPDGRTEKLTFKKFDGKALATAALQGQQIASKDIVSVTLKVNPQELGFDKKKITSKVASNKPGRFIIFDWGNDLMVLSISGSTGNLLPDAMIRGLDPTYGPIGDILSMTSAAGGLKDYRSGTGSWPGINSITKLANELMYAGLSYFELLEMSPKYRAFKKLDDEIYSKFDADVDILILELGPYVFRGHFDDFKFSITAERPWDWKYNITFVVLDDLSKFIQEDSFNSNNVADE